MSGRNYGYIFGSAAKRYPRYFRCLRQLLMNGVGKVSSAELAERLGITPSQVRADLNGFSGIGLQGYGYHVKRLYTEISRELGAGDGMTAVMIGGDAALADRLAERFEGRGVTITARFVRKAETGGPSGIRVCLLGELETVLAREPASLAVLIDWLPEEETLPDRLLTAGIRGIWNLTQRDLSLPIPVLNLPVGDIIMSLCCDVRHAQSEQNGKEI